MTEIFRIIAMLVDAVTGSTLEKDFFSKNNGGEESGKTRDSGSEKRKDFKDGWNYEKGKYEDEKED
jgi:hypothetical protein